MTLLRTHPLWMILIVLIIGEVAGCDCGCSPRVGERVLISLYNHTPYEATILALSDSGRLKVRDTTGFVTWVPSKQRHGGYGEWRRTWARIKDVESTDQSVPASSERPSEGALGEDTQISSPPTHYLKDLGEWATLHSATIGMGAYVVMALSLLAIVHRRSKSKNHLSS